MIRILLIVASLTLFAASAVHAGLAGPIDPFDAAALPEAILGCVLALAALATLVWWPRAWAIALIASVVALVGTLVGLRFTLPRGEFGDIAYHLALLATLLVTSALLLRYRTQH